MTITDLKQETGIGTNNHIVDFDIRLVNAPQSYIDFLENTITLLKIAEGQAIRAALKGPEPEKYVIPEGSNPGFAEGCWCIGCNEIRRKEREARKANLADLKKEKK